MCRGILKGQPSTGCRYSAGTVPGVASTWYVLRNDQSGNQDRHLHSDKMGGTRGVLVPYGIVALRQRLWWLSSKNGMTIMVGRCFYCDGKKTASQQELFGSFCAYTLFHHTKGDAIMVHHLYTARLEDLTTIIRSHLRCTRSVELPSQTLKRLQNPVMDMSDSHCLLC